MIQTMNITVIVDRSSPNETGNAVMRYYRCWVVRGGSLSALMVLAAVIIKRLVGLGCWRIYYDEGGFSLNPRGKRARSAENGLGPPSALRQCRSTHATGLECQ